MQQSAKTVWLFPDNNGVVKEEPKKGCPFATIVNKENKEILHP